MLDNKKIEVKLSWKLLTVVFVTLIYAFFSSFSYLTSFHQLGNVVGLVTFSVGVVLVLGGYILTVRSRYEIFPTKIQVIGSVACGALLSVSFMALLSVFFVSPGTALSLVAIYAAIEFLFQRIFQSRRLGLSRLLALIVLGGVIVVTVDNAPMVPAGIFLASIVAKELVSRLTQTHLLSSWVTSFWGGIVLVCISLLVTFNVISLGYEFGKVGFFELPLWMGFVTFLMGSSVVFLLFLERKIRISRGYIQHKMQLLTALLLLVMMATGIFDNALILSFVLLISLYSVAEHSVFPKH